MADPSNLWSMFFLQNEQQWQQPGPFGQQQQHEQMQQQYQQYSQQPGLLQYQPPEPSVQSLVGLQQYQQEMQQFAQQQPTTFGQPFVRLPSLLDYQPPESYRQQLGQQSGPYRQQSKGQQSRQQPYQQPLAKRTRTHINTTGHYTLQQRRQLPSLLKYQPPGLYRQQLEQQHCQQPEPYQQYPCPVRISTLLDNVRKEMKKFKLTQRAMDDALFLGKTGVMDKLAAQSWENLEESWKPEVQKLSDWLEWSDERKRQMKNGYISRSNSKQHGASDQNKIDENAEPEDVEASIARLLPLGPLSEAPKETGEMIKFQMEYHGISMDMLTRKILGVDIKTIQKNGRNVDLMKQLIGLEGLRELFDWWMMNGEERMEWAKATRKEYGIQIEGLTPFEMEQVKKSFIEKERREQLENGPPSAQEPPGLVMGFEQAELFWKDFGQQQYQQPGQDGQQHHPYAVFENEKNELLRKPDDTEDVEISIARLLPLDQEDPKDIGRQLKLDMKKHHIFLNVLTMKILGVVATRFERLEWNEAIVRRLVAPEKLKELYEWLKLSGMEKMEWARAARQEFGIKMNGMTPFEMECLVENIRGPMTDEEVGQLADELLIPVKINR